MCKENIRAKIMTSCKICLVFTFLRILFNVKAKFQLDAPMTPISNQLFHSRKFNTPVTISSLAYMDRLFYRCSQLRGSRKRHLQRFILAEGLDPVNTKGE